MLYMGRTLVHNGSFLIGTGIARLRCFSSIKLFPPSLPPWLAHEGGRFESCVYVFDIDLILSGSWNYSSINLYLAIKPSLSLQALSLSLFLSSLSLAFSVSCTIGMEAHGKVNVDGTPYGKVYRECVNKQRNDGRACERVCVVIAFRYTFDYTDVCLKLIE